MKKLIFVLIAFLIIVLTILVGSIGYAWYQIRREIHHRFANNWQSFPKPPFFYQTLSFLTSDGLRIYSWYLPVKDSKAVVILVHGFDPDGGKAGMLETSRVLHDANYSTLLIELRGVGQSDGDGETLGVEEWKDLEAAYDYMASLPENKGKKIGFLGESMGASTSIIEVGLTGKGDFVIAADPYASYKQLFDFRIKMRRFPVVFRPITRVAAAFELGYDYDRFSPDRLILNIHVPIFIAWSSKDEIIGPNQGSYLITLANEPKMGWEVNSGHDIISKNGDAFNQKVFSFLEKYASQDQ